MTGSEICTSIISTVKERIHSDEFRKKYRVGNSFTRIRKLTIGIVMMFLLCSRKKSLPNETDIFRSHKEQLDTGYAGTALRSTRKAARP